MSPPVPFSTQQEYLWRHDVFQTANCKLYFGLQTTRQLCLDCGLFRRLSGYISIDILATMMFFTSLALLLATASAFYVQPSVKISAMRGLMMNNAERTYM